MDLLEQIENCKEVIIMTMENKKIFESHRYLGNELFQGFISNNEMHRFLRESFKNIVWYVKGDAVYIVIPQALNE